MPAPAVTTARASTSWRGRRVTVMGLGRFGGGVGVTRWLAARDARVLVTDVDGPDRLASSLRDLSDLVDRGRVTLRLGGHDEAFFTDADLVVVNPAVPKPWVNPYLVAARDAGVPLTTEIRLVTERLDRQRVIGVTGTAGKSTTAAMTRDVLATLTGAPVRLGGNIGGSLLGSLGDEPDGHWTVLELSSAMLHWLDAAAGAPDDAAWSPRVAVITNIAPNHLDWHGTMEHYVQSKLRIVATHGPGDTLVAPASIARWTDRPPRSVDLPADRPVLAVPGRHNRVNARLAISAALAALDELDAPDMLARAERAVARFRGLSHRLQLIVERGGIRYIDDSKSTTPEATVLAVGAFDDPGRVHVIVGGFDKGVDLRPIVELADVTGGMYAIGATAPRIVAQASTGTVEACGTLEQAVGLAATRLRPGDVLLLSPGCASWDQFENYEQRGRRFAELIREEGTNEEGTKGQRD